MLAKEERVAKEENSGQRGKEWQRRKKRWKMKKGWQISNEENKNWSIDKDKLSWQEASKGHRTYLVGPNYPDFEPDNSEQTNVINMQ